MNNSLPKLAVFISGTGTNLQALIDACRNKKLEAEIVLVVSSSAAALGLTKAEKAKIPSFVYLPKEYSTKEEAVKILLEKLRASSVDYIVLAGFIKLVPSEIIESYKDKIVNIHPALLPKYGGKGMYGLNVHQAVLTAGDKESGLTIHLVDEQYDHGRVLTQIKVPVYEDDTPALLQQRIQVEEHKHFPIVINKFIKGEL